MGPFSEAVVRDLLRHIDHAGRLRRNAIVVEMLRNAPATLDDRGVVRHVRGAIAMALESMAPHAQHTSRAAALKLRLRTLIECCDLRGELHRVVAAQLGLSQAQFYRDRRSALVLLAETLAAQLAASKYAAKMAPDDVGESRWRIVAHLQNVGHFSAARTMLERLTSELLPPAERARAFHTFIGLLCRMANHTEARDALAAAQRTLANGASDSDAMLANVEMLAAQAQLASSTRQTARAIQTADCGIALLRTDGDSLALRHRELLLEFFNVLAFSRCEAGSFEQALATVETAKALCDARTDPALIAELHFHAMRAHIALPWGMSEAARDNEIALSIARHHTLVRYEAAALGNLCAVHFVRGDYEAASACGREALIVSEPVAAPMDYALLLLTLGRVEIARGDGARALTMLRQAKSFAGENRAACAEIEIAEAEACAVAGDFTQAARISARAQHVFETFGARKLVGPALCTQAQAYIGLGERRTAVAVIHHAVDAIEENGTAYWQAQVYNASARITGNKRHAGYAASLRAELRS